MKSNPSPKVELKVVVLGDTFVGKSTFINCLLDGPRGFQGPEFPQTMGVEVLYHQFIVNRKLLKVSIRDTAGQERYRAANSSLYRKAQGALLLVDLSDKFAETSLNYWVQEFKEKAEPEAPIFLVGNKADLKENPETLKKVMKYAEKHELPFYKTSAKFGENVYSVMENLLSSINEKIPENLPLKGRHSWTNTRDVVHHRMFNVKTFSKSTVGENEYCCL